MRLASRDRVYTARVSAKLRQETADAIEEAANAAGVKVGEWVRDALCEALVKTANNRTVLAEVVALRTIFLTIQMRGAVGCKVEAPELEEIVELADARKFALADKRIYEAVSQ